MGEAPLTDGVLALWQMEATGGGRDYRIRRLVEEVERLKAALSEAAEEMEDMVAYVPDYFRKKWEYDEAIARAQGRSK